jgi:hypothetical protein
MIHWDMPLKKLIRYQTGIITGYFMKVKTFMNMTAKATGFPKAQQNIWGFIATV